MPTSPVYNLQDRVHERSLHHRLASNSRYKGLSGEKRGI